MSRWGETQGNLAKRGWVSALLLIPLLLALWLPRRLELDRYVTVDEPKWLMRSGGFYTALARLDLKGTFQREHPGVTVTWAGTAGYLASFPGYFKIAPQEQPSISRFHRLLRDYQKAPLDLLVAGRVYVLVVNVACLLLAFLVAVRLIGALPALFAFLLIAFDPFFTALTRLLHPDSLLSPISFLSLLAFLAYLHLGRERRYLLLSAVAAGIAWLTKSPAFFLAPFFGLLLLVEWGRGLGQPLRAAPTEGNSPNRSGFHTRLQKWRLRKPPYNSTEAGRIDLPAVRHGNPPYTQALIRSLWRELSPLLTWFGVAAGAFVLLWPAMWADPLGSLARVFSMASTYASEGHDLRLFFNGGLYEQGQSAWYFYPIAYLWRTTPMTLVGLALALGSALFPNLSQAGLQRRRLILSLALFAVLFGTFISLGEKKFDRYLLPAFAPLTLAAALGWLSLAERLFKGRHWASGALLGAAVLVQAAGLYGTYPYYLNYYNPLLGGDRRAPEVMMIGWGEGLDQAARYLNSLPESRRAVAWYGDGCFSYFSEGQSVALDGFTTLADLRKDDHVVIYRDQWQRQLPSPEFLSFFEGFEPKYVVQIDQIEYVRVYDMQDAPPLMAAGRASSESGEP